MKNTLKKIWEILNRTLPGTGGVNPKGLITKGTEDIAVLKEIEHIKNNNGKNRILSIACIYFIYNGVDIIIFFFSDPTIGFMPIVVGALYLLIAFLIYKGSRPAILVGGMLATITLLSFTSIFDNIIWLILMIILYKAYYTEKILEIENLKKSLETDNNKRVEKNLPTSKN
ncbi:MAG: hypothetical protein COU06_00955 [Candidatus Harrisonbacteria bacterium CG10_big_fil_rev_8_21_14_0_10_38_8]|uniref:Uncharacterized protein n=1 Tax=Candidatus Harrisonbacteria bacterium CG10_big_fil_rev_8_21_14_0_10_38_8 TaxID=1974582 RepID=A0A2M6WKD7_9BACT|nr:MAG: hypothetical protein COU06_00955 [Candidatus Harrisonbacteria bacterium CG10_big_fil_rev_8_21_14_0_10_38_8]